VRASRPPELRFEVALGGRSEKVENLRLPLGEGLAGYVASTGQPLAVSNVEHDARFAAAFAQKVAYIPKTVLCVRGAQPHGGAGRGGVIPPRRKGRAR
jgi:hypothetical protein